ncbi:MAG: bifunctional DNA-binding transcriptional regulator/O6-methylguanine-DNA methyltransferase Ada [Anaerolineaceae bacterium]|nr:bifunctional DNA-binding transcriptional regulator/O6-methylguanine-DNA methyltransferase Ada [Anaerolineaceae bacterium]
MRKNSNIFKTEENRWDALVQRNPLADGKFVYAVRSTGVYCRPNCTSRKPNKKNVLFFEHSDEAVEAGFRPCKRCTPQENKAPEPADMVLEACEVIDNAEIEPSLSELAQAVNLSPYHFQRLFKKTLGITPKQYMIQKRMTRVRKNLRKKKNITEAVYDSGFLSSSSFYKQAEDHLGMTPSKFHQGGKNVVIYYGIAKSYLGWVLVAKTNKGICQIEFGDSKKLLVKRLSANFPEANLLTDDVTLSKNISQVITYLKTPQKSFPIPLDIMGTAFQKKVWDELKKIPPGTTKTYSEIAAAINQPEASRAVANAIASNKIAAAIPCHRVIRKDGKLGGYHWGIDRKKKILEREKS